MALRKQASMMQVCGWACKPACVVLASMMQVCEWARMRARVLRACVR